MDYKTEVAKLRIEIRTKTRLVLRVVELTTRTTLPTTAKIIRAARGWYADRAFKFAACDTVWTSTRSRRSGNERPARNRRFLEVVQKGRRVEFTHDVGRKRKLTFLVSSRNEAIPRATVRDRRSNCATTRSNGPSSTACSGRATSTRYGWAAGGRSEATNPGRGGTARDPACQGNRAGLRADGPDRRSPAGAAEAPPGRPAAGRQDRGGTRAARRPLGDCGRPGDAWSAMEDAAHQPENFGRYLKEAEELARRVPADLAVTCAYGQFLEDGGRRQEARNVYQHTVDVGTRALPAKFKGVVDGMSDQGRGLLTALAGRGRYEAERGSRQRAIDLLETLSCGTRTPGTTDGCGSAASTSGRDASTKRCRCLRRTGGSEDDRGDRRKGRVQNRCQKRTAIRCPRNALEGDRGHR